MVLGLYGAEDRSGASQSDREVFQPEKKQRREVDPNSGVLYEYRVERSRATRGATQLWVVAPGARRRVFYFAAVIRGSDEWEEVPQGISTTSRKATKTPSKIPVKLGQSWKASSRRVCTCKPCQARRSLSPARQVLRHSGHSDRLGKKVL